MLNCFVAVRVRNCAVTAVDSKPGIRSVDRNNEQHSNDVLLHVRLVVISPVLDDFAET